MLRLLILVGGPAALVLALLYQSFLEDFVTVLGIWRRAQLISDFPYICNRIRDEGLHSCKDLWLSQETRTLYMICADRKQTSPELKSDTSHNSPDDVIVALDLDKHSSTGLNYSYLTTPTFLDGVTHLSALSGLSHTNGASLFVVANCISPFVPADPTIEHFLHLHTSPNITHRHTFASALISSPRALAPVDYPIAVFFTNFHSPTLNPINELIPDIFPDIFPTGSLDLRDTSDSAAMHIATGLWYPTGLVYAHEGRGRIYVSHSARGGGGVSVFTKSPDRGWWQSHRITVPYAAGHLSLDQRGDLWMVGHTSLWEAWKTGEDAKKKSTVLRVRRDEVGTAWKTMPQRVLGIKPLDRGWRWEKMLEDGEGKILKGIDQVVSDAETGRLFLSGGESSSLVVCEKARNDL